MSTGLVYTTTSFTLLRAAAISAGLNSAETGSTYSAEEGRAALWATLGSTSIPTASQQYGVPCGTLEAWRTKLRGTLKLAPGAAFDLSFAHQRRAVVADALGCGDHAQRGRFANRQAAVQDAVDGGAADAGGCGDRGQGGAFAHGRLRARRIAMNDGILKAPLQDVDRK